MIVVCLEGCHGAGKTELLNSFASAGFPILDEAFLEMPEYALHPQSLLMETTWVCSWFERLLKKANDLKKEDHPPQVFIADRSPFSAVFYSQRSGRLLEPLIREHMIELFLGAHIDVYTVHVRVERELLWKRIQDRLLREPHREKYNEGDKSWMEKTLNFYEQFRWDVEVQNSSTISELQEKVLSTLTGHSDRFEHSLTLHRKNTSNRLSPMQSATPPPDMESVSSLFSPIVEEDGDDDSFEDEDSIIDAEAEEEEPHQEETPNSTPLSRPHMSVDAISAVGKQLEEELEEQEVEEEEVSAM